MFTRVITLVNQLHNYPIITENKTIIEFAFDYTRNEKNQNQVMIRIKTVRLYKGVFLPFELIGIDTQ